MDIRVCVDQAISYPMRHGGKAFKLYIDRAISIEMDILNALVNARFAIWACVEEGDTETIVQLAGKSIAYSGESCFYGDVVLDAIEAEPPAHTEVKLHLEVKHA